MIIITRFEKPMNPKEDKWKKPTCRNIIMRTAENQRQREKMEKNYSLIVDFLVENGNPELSTVPSECWKKVISNLQCYTKRKCIRKRKKNILRQAKIESSSQERKFLKNVLQKESDPIC